MRFTASLFGGIAGVATALALIQPANADSITYNFSVTATTGPLTGITAHGTFAYDSSSIVPGGDIGATGLLTALRFTWDGISYNETTANTGGLDFDAAGNLGLALFGTNCGPGFCGVAAGHEQWDVVARSVGPFSEFTYATPAGGFWTGTLTMHAVPEPTSLVLLIGALVLLGVGVTMRRARWTRGREKICRS
jgi:hypothetical protein